MRILGVFNPLMRELVEMAYEFEERFVLDTTKYESTFGNSGTPLAAAIATTVAWYRDPTSTPQAQEGSAPWLTQTPASLTASAASAPLPDTERS